jgi:uncharacterized protein (TIRG00374 family)
MRRWLTVRRAQIAAGLLISVVALYFALRNVHWREVGDAIREANYLLVAAAFALLCLSLVLRTLRWRALLRPLRPKFWHLFGSLNVGYLINNLVPLQVGEVGRAYMLSELEGISATRSMSTVIVERILDMATLLLFLLILTPFVDFPGWVGASFIFLGVGVAVAMTLLIAASVHQDFAMGVIERVLKFAPTSMRPKLADMARSALTGFSVLSRPREALELVGWSVSTWLVVALVSFAGMKAFSIDVGYGAAMFVVIAVSFGWLVPSSPGQFGVQHYIVISTLTNAFDIDRNTAVSYALVNHLVFYLPPFPLGLAFLWSERRLWQRVNLMEKFRSLQGPLPPVDEPARPVT